MNNKNRLSKLEKQSGTGGEPFYFSSRKELDEFEARRDVELIVINVLYAGNKDEV